MGANPFDIDLRAFWKDVFDWMEPSTCPNCGSDHVRIRIDVKGNVDPVECDVCGWSDYSSHQSRLDAIS